MTTTGTKDMTDNGKNASENDRRMLHMELDNYLDGLLAHEEIVQIIPRTRAKSPEQVAH